jgi:hypothetical protein
VEKPAIIGQTISVFWCEDEPGALTMNVLGQGATAALAQANEQF